MPAPLFLIGFMAAGKTSVGRALAHAGRRFVDLDDAIAARGIVVAELVARDEPAFRAVEAETLRTLIEEARALGDAPVIATGGGAAAHGENLAAMRAAGLVVALGVAVGEARARAAGGTPRPLLAGASGDELARRRAATYRRAHAVVETTGRSIAEVARAVGHVERVWSALPARHRGGATIVALDERSYPVVVHDGAFDGEVVRGALAGTTRAITVIDRDVAAHWRAALPAEAGEPIEVGPGEAAKSFAVYEQLCNQLVAARLDRSSAIVAAGGGATGDLGGFVAATLFRGIAVVQLPTTLVAMTDAAIGGKTAVDLPAGKNLVGAFHQPRLVACALGTLATLPERERRAGFGELWKYALLDGPELWRLVDACAAWGNAGGAPPDELREVIARAIAYKAAIVGADERELGNQRVLLNLGHTVGHAIETAAGLHHGEAVGLGLVAAARVSAALGLGPPALEAEIAAALARTGLPSDLERYLTAEILAGVRVDKKRAGSQLRFIVIRKVGRCEPLEIAITDLPGILRRTPRA